MTTHSGSGPLPRLHVETPLLDSAPLRARHRRRVLLKLESAQPSGSFKMRGIGRLCASAVHRRGARKLVSSSGGNAGLATAVAGARLAAGVHVVVPRTTPGFARRRLETFGAAVEVHGDAWDAADERARALAQAPTSAYVPPFDHPEIWAGHATLVDEVVCQLAAQALPRPDAIVVSVGGGGLLCGVLQGLHAQADPAWCELPVVAVETHGTASLAAAVRAGRPYEIERIDGVAKSLGARRVADAAWRWTQRHEVRVVTVSDDDALTACRRLARDHQLLVEPACGAALAALSTEDAGALADCDSVLVVVCGGSVVELDTFVPA